MTLIRDIPIGLGLSLQNLWLNILGKSLATFSGLFNGLWLKRHKARNKSIGGRVGEKEKLLLLQLA